MLRCLRLNLFDPLFFIISRIQSIAPFRNHSQFLPSAIKPAIFCLYNYWECTKWLYVSKSEYFNIKSSFYSVLFLFWSFVKFHQPFFWESDKVFLNKFKSFEVFACDHKTCLYEYTMYNYDINAMSRRDSVSFVNAKPSKCL